MGVAVVAGEVETMVSGQSPPLTPADVLMTPAKLVALYENTSHPYRTLSVPMTLMGHGQACDIFLGSSSVARAHALVVVDGNRFILRDLQTKEGTELDGQPVDEQPLQHDAVVKLGRFAFRMDTTGVRTFDELTSVEAAIIGPDAGMRTALNRTTSIIGRRDGCEVQLHNDEVSRVNSVIVRTSLGLFIRDLDSRSGTLVNGRNVRMAKLRDGDTIQVEAFELKVEIVRRGSLETLMGL